MDIKGDAAKYIRLSLLGVPSINGMTDYTGVLPMRISEYTILDEAEVNEWLNSDRSPMLEESVLLMTGQSLKRESC